MKPLKSAILGVAVVCSSFAAAVAAYVVYDAIVDPPRHSLPPEQFAGDNYAFVADPEAGYRYRPGYRSVKINRTVVDGKIVEIATPIFQDALGARVSGPDVAVPDRVGLIAVGGSQSWGQGVSEDQTFAAILAGMLGTTERNFAVSGTGGVSSYFQMKRGLALSPRWVIYGFWEDHLNRNLRYCANTGFPPCTPLPRVVLGGPAGPRFELPSDAAAQIDLVRDYFRAMTADAPFGWNDIAWSYRRLHGRIDAALHPKSFDHAATDEKIDAAIYVHSEMAKSARATGATLIVAYIPLYFSAEIDRAPQRLLDAAVKDGYVFVDTGMALNRLRARGESIGIAGDGHLSPAAHRAVAAAVIRELVRQKLLPTAGDGGDRRRQKG